MLQERVAESLTRAPSFRRRRRVLSSQTVLSHSLTRGPSRRRVLQEHAESLRHAPSRPRASLVSPERSAFSSDAGGLSTFAFDPKNLNAAAQKRPTETAGRGCSGGSRFLLTFHFRVPGHAGPNELEIETPSRKAHNEPVRTP